MSILKKELFVNMEAYKQFNTIDSNMLKRELILQ